MKSRRARLIVLGLVLVAIGAAITVGVVTWRHKVAAESCATCTPVVAPSSSETTTASAVITSTPQTKAPTTTNEIKTPDTTSKQAGQVAPSATSNNSAVKPGQSSGTGSPAPAPAPTPAPAPAPTATVTISIDCRTVPSIGMILSARSITLKEGDTVYSVLQRACSSAGIALDTAQYPGSGVYIRGIGGVSERAHGPLSGWLYSVNGTFASVGCSRYTLKAGDVIALRYTCDGGSDVGR